LGSPFPLNGEAGLDHTTFAISVPHEDTLDLLSALLDSMFRCVVKPDETFKTEMKRARREVDVMQGGVAEVALLNKMRAAIFEGTKYHEAFFETPLTEVTAEKIRGFIEREYTPSRLALIVTADVEERELLSHIAQCLETGRGLAGRDTTDPEREGGEVPIERQGLRDIREAGTHLRSRLDTGRRAFRRLSRDGGFSLAESCPRS
jgi:predicted Zn-dependent peptidase